MQLSTSYLGLTLRTPFIAGASPLADSVDQAKRLEDAGVGAIVMHSLFEEQILADLERASTAMDTPAESFPEALSYFARVEEFKFRLAPDAYLEQLSRLKEALDVPVIASLNGASAGGWVDYAQRIQEAGADALELNVYFLPTGLEETGQAVEDRVVQILAGVKKSVRIPIAVKLSPFFSSLPNLVRRLEAAGADGVVLFNRFFEPDFDIEELGASSKLRLSDSSELLLRLRWLGILYDRVGLSLGVTGGVHTAVDALKAIMAGANGVQMVSALLQNGPEHLGRVKDELAAWIERHEYESLDQLRGSMSFVHGPDSSVYERANYLRVLHGGHA